MTASFYTDHTSRPCANGRDYPSNSRRYHGLFGASNRVPLGDTAFGVSRRAAGDNHHCRPHGTRAVGELMSLQK